MSTNSSESPVGDIRHLEAISHSVFRALEHTPASDVLGLLIAHVVGLGVELVQMNGADAACEIKFTSFEGGRSLTIGALEAPRVAH